MRKVCFDILEDHIIICGWQQKTPQIVKELLRSEEYEGADIVIISDKENFLDTNLDRMGINTAYVYLLEGDFTDPNILRKARIDVAKIAMILPDRSGKRSNRDIDARTVLTALTIEKLNNNVYSCVELLDPEYESHMTIGNVDQVIVGGYYSGLITAHAPINEYIIPFLANLLPSDTDDKLQNIHVDREILGKSFDEVLGEFRKERKILLMGVKTSKGELLLNPEDYSLRPGDCLLGIAKREKNKKI